MKCRKRLLAFVSMFFAALLLSNAGKLHAHDAGPASLVFAATKSTKCINSCRARLRDCLSLNQLPSFECRGIYQDCTRNICNVVQGRPAPITGPLVP
jgi:hypothetical protein